MDRLFRALQQLDRQSQFLKDAANSVIARRPLPLPGRAARGATTGASAEPQREPA